MYVDTVACLLDCVTYLKLFSSWHCIIAFFTLSTIKHLPLDFLSSVLFSREPLRINGAGFFCPHYSVTLQSCNRDGQFTVIVGTWLHAECHTNSKLRSSLNESDLLQQSVTRSRLKLILLRYGHITILLITFTTFNEHSVFNIVCLFVCLFVSSMNQQVMSRFSWNVWE